MAAVFDEHMKNRLLAFQKAHGLAEDGVVGAKTWAKIAQVPDGAAIDQGSAASTSTAAGGDAATSGGHHGAPPAGGYGAVLTAANFPVLFKVVEACRDEDSVKNFLRAEAGLDLDEVLATIDAVLTS